MVNLNLNCKATLKSHSPTIRVELIDAHHMLLLVVLLQDMCDDRCCIIITAPHAYRILILQYGQKGYKIYGNLADYNKQQVRSLKKGLAR